MSGFDYSGASSGGAAAEGGDGIGGTSGSTDNAVLRADGTGGATAQGSEVKINDAGTVDLPAGQSIRFGATDTINYTASTGPRFFDSNAGAALTINVQALTQSRTKTIQDVAGTLYETGGVDVSVADGGTGASTPSGARTNLGFRSAVTTSDFPKSDTVLADVTDLSLSLGVGTWQIDLMARVGTEGTGGCKLALAGTATVDTLSGSYTFASEGEAIVGGSVNIMGTFLDLVPVAESSHVTVRATAIISVAGTFTLQFAENTTDAGTPSVVRIGSTLTALQL